MSFNDNLYLLIIYISDKRCYCLCSVSSNDSVSVTPLPDDEEQQELRRTMRETLSRAARSDLFFDT